MPFFSKVFRHRDGAGAGKSKTPVAHTTGLASVPAKPKFVATWTSKEIDPEEVQELIHACTLEMKSRAEALDAPFFLLPFRPEVDVSPARTFIGNFYTANAGGSAHYTGASLRKELVLTDPAVLCSILKWCWSRIPGGVVTWPTYEGFRMGERDSHMARNAFTTFVPLCVDTPARSAIIFDFFDLLAAVAAHAKLNGLGGRKLSRMAAWWAFDHADDTKNFDAGYKSWATAADASSHLFFAYLHSLAPEYLDGFKGINALPRSLQALVAQTEYPPETPSLMQRKTPKVVMLVHSVSSGPFALLRRAKHFEYRDEELQAFSEYDDPVQALTEECKRVLGCIAAANQSTAARSRSGMNLAINEFGAGGKPDESWSRFQDFGFSDFSNEAPKGSARPQLREGLRSAPRSRNNNGGRPTTPSWADFLNSGFVDESGANSAAAATTLLLPPDKVLPPLGPTVPQSSGDVEEDMVPGELASISTFDLDDTFWWVWMTSLASEEPAGRKAVFGRCALIETGILGGRWLVMEEQIKGASPEPAEGAYIAEKTSRFGFTRRNKQSRRRSGVLQKSPPTTLAPLETAPRAASATPSKSSISPDQQARIKAAAASLAQNSRTGHENSPQRRGRYDDTASAKTNSVMTLGLSSEAGPAMKWARDFDKDAIRKQYLGDNFAGKANKDILTGGPNHSDADEMTTHDDTAASPVPPPKDAIDRELPPVPQNHVQHSAEVISTPDQAFPSMPQIDESNQSSPVEEETTVVASPAKPKATMTSESLPVEQVPATSGVSASPRVVQIERKPVPKTAPRLNNIHEHPAFRNKSGGIKPAEKAAGLEAQPSHGDPSRKGGQSGFRKLFGKRREDEAKRNSLVLPQSSGSLQAPSESSLVRKLSNMRRKAPTPRQDSSATISISSMDHSTGPMTPDFPTPRMHDHQLRDDSSFVRPDTQERADAEHAFQRFDQGPLSDAPAFTPRESMDSIDNPNSPHAPVDIDHIGAPGAFPETPMEYGTPMEPVYGNDGASEASIPGQDRWAQIRKNAAERAARMSEDQNSRPAQSILTERTEDDGDTSGEETIEARVARIKARVAELTGNLEPSSGGSRH